MPEFTKSFSHWGKKRHIVQAFVLLTFLLLPVPIPFISGLEHGTLRFDCDLWRIHFFGVTLVPGLFHIFFLGFVIPLFALAVSSMLYSKVFCGWVCPQNIFYEMFDGIIYRLKKRFPSFRRSVRAQNALDFSLALGWGVLLAYTATTYFIGAAPIVYGAIFTVILVFFTFDAHWLKHKFCESACPYALLQKSFQDKQSLHVAWEDRPGNRCGICTACEKACYVDLNIRKDPYQVDCTMCGACVDACERVFSRKPEPPLLKFVFEEPEPTGLLRRLGINSFLKGFIVVAFIGFCSFFLLSIFYRPMADFRLDYPISGEKNQLPFVVEGKQRNAYTLRIRNMTGDMQQYKLDLKQEGFRVIGEDESLLLVAVDPYERVLLPFHVEYDGEASELGSVTLLSFDVINVDNQSLLGSQEILFRTSESR